MVNSTDLISGAEAQRLLGGICKRSLKRYRDKYWFEGCHYVQPVHRVLYIRPMIVHWMVNRKNNPKAHEEAIKAWLIAQGKRGCRR
jgi:hypothetical protein